MVASWHFLPTILFKFRGENRKSRKYVLMWEVAWCCLQPLYDIPRTRLLTTSWIWYRWQWTQRFFFVLACNSCTFHRHYFHHLGSSKFEFFIYTKKTYRHLPNILLFQWCFGWNVLLLWKTSKKFFFYNKIIMNMLGLIIGLFLLYYYGIFFHLAVYLLVWYGLLGLVFFFLEYNFFHPNNIYKLSLLAHNIHIFHAKKQCF